MKKKALGLLLVSLTLSFALTACSPEEPELSATTPASNPEISQTSSDETSYAGLGLTEDEIKMLEERGIASVDTVEVASKIAGFEVSVPAYVPDGFLPGKYSITISGAGLPEEMSPKFNNTKVEQTFTYQEDRNIIILLIQSPHPFGIGGGESAEICGQPGERKYTEADPTGNQPYDKLTLGCERDGITYALTGMLGGTLDEAEMEKMACSIGAE